MKADFIMQSPPVFSELDSQNTVSSQEDQRALQIALELSNLGLLGSCDDENSSSYDDLIKNKKSQNMTECVPVPSSEHVAEIVGRQGCKIKALRAKTNTYIKTPVRGEEPVFVVTGRKEDVAMARREVQSAAEHFTQIRASRNRHAMINGQGLVSGADAELTAGTITLQVRVPYRVVGLVVGPKGATIKRIQQQTHTYIVTPSREKEPVFEVTGLPENVEKAKEEIEAHIASRTGSLQTNIDDDFKNNGTEVGSPCSSDTLLKSTARSTTSSETSYNIQNSVLRCQAPSFFPSCSSNGTVATQEYISRAPPKSHDDYHNLGRSSVTANNIFEPVEKALLKSVQAQWSIGSNDIGHFESLPHAVNLSGSNGSSAGLSPTSSYTSNNGRTCRLSPTLSDKDFSTGPSLLPSQSHKKSPSKTPLSVRHTLSDSSEQSSTSANSNFLEFGPSMSSAIGIGVFSSSSQNIESGYSSSGTCDSLTSGSPMETALGHVMSPRAPDTAHSSLQKCIICNEGSVVAALVPCGHNLFCYGCAQGTSVCPCCHQPASMALLIKK
ncbi:RNA-binding protein MEX3B-like [Clavelina lepadiformis]|uniref:RING-type domain-containing protein n=1 Tax=Clavelina lepadiformis TaxID=159417 RepID=A0ABP0FBA2_CLALP